MRLVQLAVIPCCQQLYSPAMPGLQLSQWHHADDGDRNPRALKMVHHLPELGPGPAGSIPKYLRFSLGIPPRSSCMLLSCTPRIYWNVSAFQSIHHLRIIVLFMPQRCISRSTLLPGCVKWQSLAPIRMSVLTRIPRSGMRAGIKITIFNYTHSTKFRLKKIQSFLSNILS